VNGRSRLRSRIIIEYISIIRICHYLTLQSLAVSSGAVIAGVRPGPQFRSGVFELAGVAAGRLYPHDRALTATAGLVAVYGTVAVLLIGSDGACGTAC